MTPGIDATNASVVQLYWIPLGAGARVVRLSGRLYEAFDAWRHRRPAVPLYHSALVVLAPEGRFIIEQTPIPRARERRHGVVEGPVGSKLAGHLRLFRYEVRRWRDGVIPDIADAVGSPVGLSDDPARASQVVELVPLVPALVWGRDQEHTGEMWNSNSVIAWLLERAGLDAVTIQPPAGGRAPGWSAGREIARRERVQTWIETSGSCANAASSSAAMNSTSGNRPFR
ncbi:MAG TPA: hypothetical protein VIX62_04675 [Actinomycetota bacterium]